MDKDEILQKSREENAAAFMDERERNLRLREDSFALGCGLLLALALFLVKVARGQPAADLLALITGMSAAGFLFRCVKSGVMDDKLILKNRLKDARTERGLSQSALAELVGVSRNTISSIETGQFNPTAKLALVLCIALDKKFEELFYF